MAKALPELASVIAPPVAETFSAVAWIAPVWPTAPLAVNASVPPTVADAMVNPVESVRVALSVPPVATVAVAKLLVVLVSVIAPLLVEDVHSGSVNGTRLARCQLRRSM